MCLTQAVIEGRKTQTRRIVPQSLIDKYEEWYDDVCCIAKPSGSTIETIKDWLLRKHTRYNVGEVVAVAQSYRDCGYNEFALDRSPKDYKFNNEGRMIYNCFDWGRDDFTIKVHPTQKPVPLLENLIRLFTDEGDVVIDPCAGSGTTLLAAANLKRKAYGFEVNKQFFNDANNKVLTRIQHELF